MGIDNGRSYNGRFDICAIINGTAWLSSCLFELARASAASASGPVISLLPELLVNSAEYSTPVTIFRASTS